MARKRGFTCPNCGSSEPATQGEVRTRQPDGGADVAMDCRSCEGASEMTRVLSPEEARALGLQALRGDPEAT